MAILTLAPRGLTLVDSANDEGPYRLADLRRQAWDWDSVVKATHSSNCGYNIGCSLNVFVKDGVVVREEVAPAFPARRTPRCRTGTPASAKRGRAIATGCTIPVA